MAKTTKTVHQKNIDTLKAERQRLIDILSKPIKTTKNFDALSEVLPVANRIKEIQEAIVTLENFQYPITP